MKSMRHLSSILTVIALSGNCAVADTSFGDLNNFDVFNETGQVAYGFEIEVDGIHSTDITYTYGLNHYRAPKITEDNSDPDHPKVFVRYESDKYNSSWVTQTNPAPSPITAPENYRCIDFMLDGPVCEHFGVGYSVTPIAVKYNWLIENPNAPGTLIHSQAVNIATPTWTYSSPQPAIGLPAQVIAKIQAPLPPENIPPANLPEFGNAVWVKAIKTTTHNNHAIRLPELISEDPYNPNNIYWNNGEPTEVEVEWKLMQDQFAVPDGTNDSLFGSAEVLPNNDESVTRRYEFYKYVGPLDPVSNQAVCDKLPPIDPATDPNANAQCFALGEAGLKGDYIGAQMSGYNVKEPLGTIDYPQDAEINQPYPPRSLVIGGNKPYIVNTISPLPAGLSIDQSTGVLSGIPSIAGYYPFFIEITDADGVQIAKGFPLNVVDSATPNSQYALSVVTAGNGLGIVQDGGGIYCNPSCSGNFFSGSSVTLTAEPTQGSSFSNWSGDACEGSTALTCTVTMNAAKTVTATFTMQQPTLVVNKDGNGAGNVSGNGIDCGDTCLSTYESGTAVSLTATPAVGSNFIGWSGACSGTGTCNLTMDAVKTVTATFDSQQYILSVSKAGAGSGTVSGNWASGINCGTTCSATLNYGTYVSLTATPATGSIFTGWSGACSGTGACTVTIDAAKNVTATFAIQQYSLMVSKAGNGSGTVSGNGINCGTTCSAGLNYGTAVSLTATPAAGSTFTGWSGACSGTGACNVTMDAAKNVTATFALQQYSFSVSKTGIGSGTVSGTGINCGTTCSFTYSYGTVVSLTATPATGSVFTGWGGACSGTGTCYVQIDAVKNVTATFSLPLKTLSVSKLGTGAGTVVGGNINCGISCSTSSVTIEHGTSVSLTATPATGSTFTGWGGACSGTSTCSVTMNADKNVSASFALQAFTFSVTTTGNGTVTGGQINCGTSCSTVLNFGDSITLTAAPAAGYAFSGWSGDCTGSATTCTVAIDSAKTVGATFVPIKYTLSVTKTNGSYGTVTSNPAGINCGTACSSQFNMNTSVVLTATPAQKRRFSGWTGACTGSSLTCTVQMTQNKSVNATFR